MEEIMNNALVPTFCMPVIKIKKNALPRVITQGEEITYTTSVSNQSKVAITKAFFKDVLVEQLSFVKGSILVNGNSDGYDCADPNEGFFIGGIVCGESITINFKASVKTVLPKVICNRAGVKYQYINKQTGGKESQIAYSNVVKTPVTFFNLRQTSVDIIQSIALQQAAIAHIINAEGEKIQKALTMCLTTQQLIVVNKSVQSVIEEIIELELLLRKKLRDVEYQTIARH